MVSTGNIFYLLNAAYQLDVSALDWLRQGSDWTSGAVCSLRLPSSIEKGFFH